MKKMMTVLGIGFTTLELAAVFILEKKFKKEIKNVCKQYGVSTPEEALAIIMAEKQKKE